MRIKFLQDWKPDGSDTDYKAEQVIDTDQEEALELIGKAIADPVRDEPGKKTTTDATDWQKEVAGIIREEIAKLDKPEPKLTGTALKGEPDPHSVKLRERIEDDPKRGFKSAGEFYADVYKVKDGRADLASTPRLKAISGMSESVDSEGGFLVPAEFRAQLLEKMHAKANIAQRCFNVPMATNTVEIPYINETSRATGSRGGAIQVYRIAEGGQYTTKKASFGKVALRLKKLGGFAHLTEELMQDNVISVQAIVERLLGDEMAWVTDNEILYGGGGSEMVGVMVAPCAVSVAKETGQAADTIVAENIEKMWAQLWAPSRGNAVWLINQECLPQLNAMSLDVGTGGVPVYTPPGGLSQAPYGTIKGRPVIEAEQCKTLGDKGDIMLCDFSQYVYATKGGLVTAQSVHLRFDYDETVLRFTLRNDGAPWWSKYLTPASGSTKYLSPFITLDERA